MDAITPERVQAAFDAAAACQGADDCKLMGQAMCELARFDNLQTVLNQTGRVTFLAPPEGACPNQDQLFCQERTEQTAQDL